MDSIYVPKALLDKSEGFKLSEISIGEVQENFWRSSTIHGYPNIAKGKGKLIFQTTLLYHFTT